MTDTMALGATTTFTALDQERFAAWSGDRNPMHMDPVVDRRTQLGAAAVHGVHVLLWALNELAKADLLPPEMGSARVKFGSPVLVGHACTICAIKPSSRGLKVEIQSGGVNAVVFELRIGGAAEPPAVNLAVGATSGMLGEPQEPQFAELMTRQGCFGFSSATQGAPLLFSALCQTIGAEAVAGLGALSYLVGMVTPGLHSIFGSLDVRLARHTGNLMSYRTEAVDERYRRVLLSVTSGSVSGTVEAYMRAPPVEQPSAASLQDRVPAGAFAGVSALVVGGSRGLGALAAKLLVLGGGRATVTYASGAQEAEALRDELVGLGQSIDIARLDILDPASLAGLASPDVNALYYFATPRIGHEPSRAFNARKFGDFNRFYCEGFAALHQQLTMAGAKIQTIFYPSSVFVEELPTGFIEYAMAKAAGELLCASLAKRAPHLKVAAPRLPRMLTDQTASVTPTAMADGPATLAPLMLALHSANA